MYNYSINISPEKAIHFSAGEIYFVQSKIELNKEDLFSSNGALYLNYSFDEAEKVIPFFENLGVDEQKRIIASIREIYGYAE